MRQPNQYSRHWVMFLAFFALPVLALRAEEKSEPPVPVRTFSPEVPVAFARAGGSGLVTVRFIVDVKGTVQEATIEKSSHHELDDSALKAVRKWRFKPATKDGVPVAVHVSIPIKFDVE